MANDNVTQMLNHALEGDFVEASNTLKFEMANRMNDYLNSEKEHLASTFFEEMSPKQKIKSEIIIHGLKKAEPDFKKRYGDKWKNVMYAVANKEAKEDVK